MVRRAPGTLLPLELDLLTTGVELARSGQPEFHGYAVASALAAGTGARRLTAHGTLYKALGRLAERGLLESRWEDADAAEGRPRRRLYRVTGAGAEAVADAGRDARLGVRRGATRRPPAPGASPV